MRLNNYILKLFCIFLFSLNNIHAQDSELKNLVWQDCEKALVTVRQLPAEQQQAAVEFLFEVVRLKISKHEPKFSIQPELVKAPVGLLDQVSLAQSLTPEDLLKPKQCALSLLQFMPQSAQLVLKEMLILSQDQTEDLILRLRTQEAVLEIAKALKDCQLVADCIKSEVLRDIFNLYLQNKSEIVVQIVTLFSEQLASLLLEDLKTIVCENKDCPDIKNRLELLTVLDLKSSNLESSNFKSGFLEFLNLLLHQNYKPENSDYIKLSVILESLLKIPQLYEQLLIFVLTNFNTMLLEPSQTDPLPAVYYRLLDHLFKYERENLSLVIDPNLRLKLFDILINSHVEKRNSIQLGLIPLSALGASYESNIEKLSNSKEVDLKIRAAALASFITPKSKLIESVLKKLILDKDIKVQVAAIHASAEADFISKQVQNINATAAKLYKLTTTSLMDLSTIVDLSLKFITKLKPELVSKQINELVWLLSQKIYKEPAYAEQFVEFRKFLFKQEKFLNLRLKLKNRTSEQKHFELVLLSQLPQASNYLDHIFLLLKDQDAQISKQAQILLLQKQDLPKDLVGTAKLPEILATEFGQNNQNNSVSVECADYPEYLRSCRLKSSKGNFCSMLIRDAMRCSEQVDFRSWNKADFDIFLNADVNRFRSILTEAKNKQFVCPLIESALVNNLIAEQDYAAICEVLNALTCNHLMPQILLNNKLASSCYTLIKQSFEHADNSDSRSELFKILTQIDSSSINIVTIFNDALERKDFSLLKQLVQSSLVDQMVLYLKNIILSDLLSAQELILVLDLVEDLAVRAESLLPELIRLSSRSELFYESSRAIIAVATNNLNLRVETLRKLTGSIVFPRLLKDSELNNLETSADALVESELIKLSYLEKRDLNSLLAKLSGTSVVHEEAF